MFTKLADISTNRPKRVLILAALVAVAALVLSAGLPERLASQGFQNPGSESQQAIDDIADAAGFDPDAQIVALVTLPSGGRDAAANSKALQSAAAKLKELDGVVTITSAGEGPPAQRKALTSTDGKQALVVANLAPGAEETDAGEEAIAAFEGDENVALGGAVIAQHYVSTTVEEDLRTSEMIAFPLLFLISLFVFRSLIAAALPLMIGAITIPLTFAMIGFYNEITSLSIFALNLTTGLGLGLAIDYSLLMVTRYREELDAGATTAQAVRTTIGTAGRTIAFSSLTVAGSVLVLAIFPLKFLYSMALSGFTVAIASAIVALTVLPALLMLLGPRINKFSVARKPASASNERWYHLAKGVMRRPVLTTIVTAGVVVVMALPLTNISFTSVDATVLPSENSAHVVEDAIQAGFPPSSANSEIFVAVKGAQKDAAQLSEQATRVDGVASVGPVNEIGDGTWQFDVFAEQPRYSASTTAAAEDIRLLDSKLDYKVGGFAASFVDQRATIIDKVPLALLLIGLITFVVLFVMTGSVVLPIKTFIMNIATLAATFGILTFIFGEGRLEGLLGYDSQNALEMTQPVLLFALAFGLATDYGVFLLGRIKELHDSGMDSNEAVAQGVARTGRVITSAALLFCVAIGAFSLSSIVFIKELGIGTALAVAIDATLIRALLVPALMVLLGDYNWWAPKWMQRLHGRIGFSEGPSAPAAASSSGG